MGKTQLTQDEILSLMGDGWELGWGDGIRSSGHFWIQQGGLCRGGESRQLNANTVRALIKKGKVKVSPEPKDRFWLTRYVLAK